MEDKNKQEEIRYSNFKKIIRSRLSELSMKKISERSSRVCDKIFEEEEKSAESIQGTVDDPTLDPEMEKEFFHSSFEEGDTLVTIKTLGVGRNKPVSVYLNDRRWEMFPGPKRAKTEAMKFVKSKQYESWKERKGLNKKVEEGSPEDDKEDHIKEVNEITIQGRRNLAKAAKRTAKRRAASAKRKKKRRKTKEELMAKARKMARSKIKEKMLKGKSEKELSYAAKEALEKKLDSMGPKIDKIAKKMLAVAKAQEAERIKRMRGAPEDSTGDK